MNGIRIAAAAVAVLIGAGTVASAQTPAPQSQGGKAQRGERGERGVMGHLDLTDAQKQQIKSIHEKYRAQFEQLRASSRPDVEAARAARQAGDTAAARAAMARARTLGPAVAALRQQEHAEIRAVLTAEQRTKFDARHAQMQERKTRHDSAHGRKGREHGRQGRRPNRGARPGRGTWP